MRKTIAGILASWLALAAPSWAADAAGATAAAMQAATDARQPDALRGEAASNDAPSLGKFLDVDGRLDLPAGFTGNLDPSGFALVSKPGEAPRFAAKNAIDEDARWDPQFGQAIGCNSFVRATAALSDGRIVLGGLFTICGNVAVNGVAIWNPATGVFQTLGSGAANGVNGSVNALAIAGSDVYAGGDFTQAGGVAANRVARFDTTTGSWSPLGSGSANGVSEGFTEQVFTLAIAGNDVYVGGGFTQAGGAAANRVARFNTMTQTWFPLGSGAANGVNGNVFAIAIAGSDVYAGGDFTQAGGATANFVARFTTAAQSWSPLAVGPANGVGGEVYALAVAGSDVYVGGSFTQAGEAAANFIARFNTATQSWSLLGSGAANGVNSFVFAIAIAGSDVFAGGYLTQAGGAAANSVARFDTTTQSWSSLGSGAANGVSDFVFAIAIAASDVYVGGRGEAGGAAANGVARFNATTQSWSPLGSGAANGVSSCPFFFDCVNALAIAGSDIYVAGSFTQAGGTAANRVARFNTTTQTWSPLGSGAAEGVNGFVYALAIAGSDVYVGGNFTQAGGAAANFVARFNTTTQSWSSLGSGAADGVNACGFSRCVTALAIAGSDVYVGGDFTQAGGAAANFVARFNTTTQSWSSLGSGAANGVSDIVRAIAVTGSDVYVGGRFTQAGGADANFVARFNFATQSWFPLAVGSVNGVNGDVYALAIAGSDVYVGGRFTQAGGAEASSVARFNTTVQTWTPLGSGAANGVSGCAFSSCVNAIAVAGSDVYLGGVFAQAGGEGANRVARFNTTTRTWSSPGNGVADGVNAEVYALGVSCTNDAGTPVLCEPSARPRDLYLGGSFSAGGPNFSLNIARYDVRRATTTSITASTGSAVAANSPITFTGTVATTSFPGLTGNMVFLDNGAVIVPCANQPVTGGTDTRTATCNTAALRVGSHNVVARYQGDVLNFLGTSDPVTIEVLPPSFVYIPATLPGATFNTPGYSSGTVSVSTTAGTGVIAPVSFQVVDPNLLPPGLTPAPLTNGILVSGTPTQAGTFTFTVRATDSSTTSATGGAFSSDRQYTIVVAKAAQTITPITRVDAVPLDNGVAFADGDFAVQASASSGLAVVIDSLTPTVCGVGGPGFTVQPLQLGTCTLRARQSGDGNFEAAPEVTRTFQIKATPDVFVDSAPNPSLFPLGAGTADPIVLTATVETQAGSAPTGTVRFLRAGNTIAGCASQPLSGSGNASTATCNTTSVVRGPNAVTVQYSGDALNVLATSNVHTHQLNVGTAVGIATITPNPCVVGEGCTVGVAVAAGSGTPTGSVQVASSTGGSCTVTLASGGGSCALTATTAGTGTVTATYLGSPPWLASPAANQSHPFVATVDQLFVNGFEPASGGSR